MISPDLPDNSKWLGPDPPDQAIGHSNAEKSNRIRLGCTNCDRTDFDLISELPKDWLNLQEVQTYEESVRVVDPADLSGSALDWHTHLGLCPDCSKHQTAESGEHASYQSDDEEFEIHPIIRQIINRDCHALMSLTDVIRHVVPKLRGGYEQLRNGGLEYRELFIKQCVLQHRLNQRLYIEVISGMRLTKSAPPVVERPPLQMSGRDIVRLMRKYRVTIRQLATISGISMKRIREIRTVGIDRPNVVRDWIQLITGVDPGPMPERIEFKSDEAGADCEFCGFPFRAHDSVFLYSGKQYCSVSCCRRDHHLWE